MAKNHVQEGNRLPLTAPAGGVVSGKLVVIGALAVIPMVTANAGEIFNAATGEVWRLPKVAADVAAEGDVAYFNGTEITADADDGTDTNYKAVGYFTNAAANGETEAVVMLVQGVPEGGQY